MNREMQKNNKSKNKQVLTDHKKVGKRFIPPLLQIGPFVDVIWKDCMLPELLWIGILNKYCGVEKGAELAISLAQAANNTWDQPLKKWFAPISSYSSLMDKQKDYILRALTQSNNLEILKKALTPFVNLYPESPFIFLFENSVPTIKTLKDEIEKFKTFFSTLFDKYERDATLIQANAIYIAFVTDILKVFKGLTLENFPEVANFPATELSKQVAASVRATVNGFFGTHYDNSSEWPRYFWNRGLELEPCNYQEIINENE